MYSIFLPILVQKLLRNLLNVIWIASAKESKI